MHMPAARIFNHRQTDKCNKATKRQLRWKEVEMAVRCGETEFILGGEEGDDMEEGVATFKYLGRTLDQTDDIGRRYDGISCVQVRSGGD